MKAGINQEISYSLRLTPTEAKSLCHLLDWVGAQHCEPTHDQIEAGRNMYQALVAQIRIAEGKGSI